MLGIRCFEFRDSITITCNNDYVYFMNLIKLQLQPKQDGIHIVPKILLYNLLPKCYGRKTVKFCHVIIALSINAQPRPWS